MPRGDGDSPSVSVRRRQYTSKSSAGPRSRRTPRRLVFFGLASMWGFVAGVGGLMGAMGAAGQPIQPHSGAIAGLIPALALAIVGGVIMAAAYKESKRHL